MSIFKKPLILSSAISLILAPSAMASKRLSGAGASFPSKIFTRWFFDLAKSGGPRVNYQAVGSGSGVGVGSGFKISSILFTPNASYVRRYASYRLCKSGAAVAIFNCS